MEYNELTDYLLDFHAMIVLGLKAREPDDPFRGLIKALEADEMAGVHTIRRSTVARFLIEVFSAYCLDGDMLPKGPYEVIAFAHSWYLPNDPDHGKFDSYYENVETMIDEMHKERGDEVDWADPGNECPF